MESKRSIVVIELALEVAVLVFSLVIAHLMFSGRR